MARGSGDHAWELLGSGHAREAVLAFDHLMRSHAVPELSWIVNRGLALAACGDFGAAKASFMQADQRARSDKSAGFRYLRQIAQLQWLNGEMDDALKTASQDVTEIKNGTTKYADFAGGASNGLVLYSIAAKRGDSSGVELAENFMRSLSRSKSRFAAWPGPVAGFVLGDVSLEGLLSQASGFGDLKWAAHKTHSDVGARRAMTQALFYAAAKFLSKGARARCRELLVRLGDIPNPLIELEWYLAKAELASLEADS